MLAYAHFLRPLWLFAFLPLGMLFYSLLKQKSAIKTWHNVCDDNLLPHLLKRYGPSRRIWPFFWLMGSGICMVIALAGPTWTKIDVPTYRQIQPRIILLDMSHEMLKDDILPNRLARAKFKLHDLLMQQDVGQFGLIVYTGEPFVVSPLTEDGQTIDALLPALTENVMPVDGNKLELAILDAKKLLSASGSKSGDLLVLTSHIPSSQAVDAASEVAREGMHLSVIPILPQNSSSSYFQPLAKAGLGRVIGFTNDNADINKWLSMTNLKSSYQANDMSNIPLWRDEGRWFIFIALLLLLPVFWRGWLQRINT
jgi:Ca-activated chloride channel homolog